MIRKIIKINEEKCTGCGLCAKACHEGAIAIVDGVAHLIREDYCDGLGDCLPKCPVDAISFEMREAADYDRSAVEEHLKKRNAENDGGMKITSELLNWPVQIKLTAPNAPYFNRANLLVAADCTAFSYGDFHRDFMRDRVTLVGCPKLDAIDYSVKLAAILGNNDVKSVLLTRMEVPCCGGLAVAVRKAILASGKNIPLQVVTISSDGRILG